MKLYHVNEEYLNKLFEFVETSKGKVELVGEDIRLNLKSKLAQYFSMAKLFSGEEIPELEVVCYDVEDAQKLMFMMAGWF